MDTELIQASKFAVCISVVNLVINSPVYYSLGVKIDNLLYLLTDTVVTYVLWFIYGTIFHLSAKLLGGDGSYLRSIITFLYLTAFIPITLLVSIPLQLTAKRLMLEATTTVSLAFYRRVAVVVFESPALVITLALQTAVFIYFAICTIDAFRLAHHIGRIRSLFIGLLGFVGWCAIANFIQVPLFKALWDSLRVK